MRVIYLLFSLLFLTNLTAQVPESEWRREVRRVETDRKADVQLPEEELVAVEVNARSLATGNWGYNFLGLNEYGADLAKSGKPITIFVFDTGISDHQYLRNITNYQESFSTTGEPVTRDIQGHATHVGGIYGALHPTLNIGILSEWVKQGKVELVFVKVLTHGGSGSYPQITDGVLRAMNYAVKRLNDGRIVVFNFSLGGSSPDAQLEAALNQAANAGVLLVGASGNTGSAGVNYPAKYPTVDAIAALGDNGQRANYSTHGPEVMFAAPGSFILSTYRDTLAQLSGTSMATPTHGAMAAIAASRGQLSFPTIATDIVPQGRDNFTGYGYIHARTIAEGNPTPPPPPVDTVKVPKRTIIVRLPAYSQRWHYQFSQSINTLDISEIEVEYTTDLPDNKAIDLLMAAHSAYGNWTLVPRDEVQIERITYWVGHFHNLIVGRKMNCRVVGLVGTDAAGRSVYVNRFPKVSVRRLIASLAGNNTPQIYFNAQSGL